MKVQFNLKPFGPDGELPEGKPFTFYMNLSDVSPERMAQVHEEAKSIKNKERRDLFVEQYQWQYRRLEKLGGLLVLKQSARSGTPYFLKGWTWLERMVDTPQGPVVCGLTHGGCASWKRLVSNAYVEPLGSELS